MYFLDTNICVWFLRGKEESIREKILSIPPNMIKIPVIVQAELMHGAFKSHRNDHHLSRVKYFLKPFEVVPFTPDISEVFAELKSDCERRGELVGPHDLLIGSIVVRNGGILITRNTKEFQRINGLRLQSW